MQNKVYCPECQLKEQMSRITKESVLAEVKALTDEEGCTASPQEFERRLKICDECYNLSGGIMCSLTGAYCAYRARMSDSKCPRGKWEQECEEYEFNPEWNEYL